MDRSAQAGRTIDYRKVAFAQTETLHSNPHLRRSRKMANTTPQTGYAPVNGLNIYYEIHGTGEPLVLLHGAYMTIETMGEIVPSLAESRQVIGVELQGHGHTADIDRPLTYEHMADDVAALLRHLGIEEADVFGFSMGEVSPYRSPSATLRLCASWLSPLPPTLARASTPKSGRRSRTSPLSSLQAPPCSRNTPVLPPTRTISPTLSPSSNDSTWSHLPGRLRTSRGSRRPL